jgi:hypothetical protein
MAASCLSLLLRAMPTTADRHLPHQIAAVQLLAGRLHIVCNVGCGACEQNEGGHEQALSWACRAAAQQQNTNSVTLLPDGGSHFIQFT